MVSYGSNETRATDQDQTKRRNAQGPLLCFPERSEVLSAMRFPLRFTTTTKIPLYLRLAMHAVAIMYNTTATAVSDVRGTWDEVGWDGTG